MVSTGAEHQPQCPLLSLLPEECLTRVLCELDDEPALRVLPFICRKLRTAARNQVRCKTRTARNQTRALCF
jgi:hypothetical protein